MILTAEISVGVIVERRKIDHPWQEYQWRPHAILLGAPPMADWTPLVEDELSTQYLAATMPLELHRKETVAYKYNLESRKPLIFVVLRPDEEGEHPVAVHLVTASPFEAEAYMESGEEIVDAVEMPGPIGAWIAEFIDEHHVEEAFKKRQRDMVDIEDHKFGQEPIVTLRRRMAREFDDDA